MKGVEFLRFLIYFLEATKHNNVGYMFIYHLPLLILIKNRNITLDVTVRGEDGLGLCEGGGIRVLLCYEMSVIYF